MLELDAVQTLAFAGLALFLGYALCRVVPLFNRYHLPAPVIGRLVVALAVLVASLLGSVVVCHRLSQGSFYWLSDSVADPTFAGWWKNYSDWLLPYLRTTAIYVGLAVIVHVGVSQALRLHGRARSAH